MSGAKHGDSHDDHPAPKGKVLSGSLPFWLSGGVIALGIGYWIQIEQPGFTSLDAAQRSVSLDIDSRGLSKEVTNHWCDRLSTDPRTPTFRVSRNRDGSRPLFWVRLADGLDYRSDELPPNRQLEGSMEYLYHRFRLAADKGKLEVRAYIRIKQEMDPAPEDVEVPK